MGRYFSDSFLYSIGTPRYNMGYNKVLYLERTVMRMSTRERILTIRLIEKLQGNPEYARKLGLEVVHKLPTARAD